MSQGRARLQALTSASTWTLAGCTVALSAVLGCSSPNATQPEASSAPRLQARHAAASAPPAAVVDAGPAVAASSAALEAGVGDAAAPTESEISIDAAAVSEPSIFVIDETVPASLDGHNFFLWIKGGFVQVQNDRTFRFWQKGATKPVALFSLPAQLPRIHIGALADPAGERVAAVVLRPGAGVGFAAADLYLWSSKGGGLRRLLATTPKQPIQESTLVWSADGKWIGVEGYAKDCKYEEGRELVYCTRILLVDAETGAIGYRTPAGLAPRGAELASGRLYIQADSPGADQEEMIGGLGATEFGAFWYELDIAKRSLSRSKPPAHASPDGRYRVVAQNRSVRVIPSDGSVGYVVVEQWLGEPRWIGDHGLVLGDLELNLQTKRVRKLWPDGFSGAGISPDARMALAARTTPAKKFEFRWAKPR